jgi:hypothetical protein
LGRRGFFVDYILRRFESELSKELANLGSEMEHMKTRKTELEAQIARLTDGLATGVYSPTISGEISKRELEVSEISDLLLSSRPESVHSRIARLRELAMGRIKNLRHHLNGDPATARAHLIKHVQSIVMEPNGKAYVASGRWNLFAAIRWECAEGQS